MNRKIKLSLITLLSVGCISVASLPLVSCGNNETTSDVVIAGITLIATPSLTYTELQATPITLLTVQKVFGGIDETNYGQFEISMSSLTGQVTMDLTAKEGFVFSDNKNILKSNSFSYPKPPKDHSFITANGINISAKADGTASIIASSTTYTSVDLVIEDSYVSQNDSNRYTITSIGINAFKDNVLTTLDLTKNTSLTSIGDWAFGSSQLTTLDLTKNTSLTSIGDQAFFNSKLTTLDLSKNTSLTSIGNYAFGYSKLTTLDLSKNTSLTSIGALAFLDSTLTTLILPTSLTGIGPQAFRDSTPTTLIIPNSVTVIGDNAFASTRILDSNLEMPARFRTIPELARIGITII